MNAQPLLFSPISGALVKASQTQPPTFREQIGCARSSYVVLLLLLLVLKHSNLPSSRCHSHSYFTALFYWLPGWQITYRQSWNRQAACQLQNLLWYSDNLLYEFRKIPSYNRMQSSGMQTQRVRNAQSILTPLLVFCWSDSN